MNTKSVVKRILAMALSFMLVLTTMPVTALTAYAQDSGVCTHVCGDGTCGYVEGADCDHAHDESCGEDCAHDCNDGTCAYIAAALCKHEHGEDCGGTTETATPTDMVVLGFSTPAQALTVPLGTSYGDLPLPETVSATVEDEPDTADVPVEWTDDDSYDGDVPGDYGFTGELGAGYILADGVNPPTLTVTVADTAVLRTITAFAELSEDIRFQRGYAPNLPETVEGTVEVETVQIPVTWQSEEYDSLGMAGGLAVFTAKLADGYITADGVNPPTIAFMRETMTRMGGAGTYGDPLKIVSAAQLAEIAELTNAGKLEETVLGITGITTEKVYLKLMNDIDLSAYGANWDSGAGWTPIGTYNTPFKGQFNGNGKTVTGLYINSTGAIIGLFGYVGNGAMVQKLGVVNADVKGNTHVGGVVGIIDGSTVQNCYATGSVSGVQIVGGVAGHISGGTVQNCYATGSVSGSASGENGYVGGVVGQIDGGTVQNCYATGSVSGNSFVGGVAGYVYGTVQNCAALNPSVSGSSSVGRVVGNHQGGTVENNYAYSGMTVTGNGSSRVDGTSKSAAQIAGDGTLFGLFANDGNPWTTAIGSLPGFGAAVPMPVHLLTGTANPFSGGDGESGSPYEISTAEQLAALAQLVNDSATNAQYGETGVYYKLTADIDLSAYSTGAGWTPIGNSTNSFKGQFNGDKHTVTGLYINASTLNVAGLFGNVGTGAVVQNLGVVNARVTSTGNNVGGVVGSVTGNSTVQNCYVTGGVNGAGINTGGVVGIVGGDSATVENCYATASVSGNTQVGGVAGSVGDSATVENCYATGSVTGTGSAVGGVAGLVLGTVKNCAALNPSVSGTGDVGRVVGYYSSSTVANIYAYSGMTVNGSGGDDGTDISAGQEQTASFWTATLSWTGSGNPWTIENTKLPGLFGAAVPLPEHLRGSNAHPFDGGTGIGTANAYEISTAEQLAWLAGQVNEGSNAYANADVYYKLTADIDLSAYGSSFNSGKGWIPIGYDINKPFQGKFDGSGKTVSGLYINDSIRYSTGLFGHVASGAAVQNLGVANADVTGYNHVGGVAGEVYGTVENCYATGSVNGTNSVGGVAGQVMGISATVQNCYATASVSGNEKVGGVAGHVFVSGATVQNCYATGSVNGTNNVGGVAGYVSGGKVQNCAALNPKVSGESSVGRVIGYNNGGTVANNYAYSGMLNKAGTTTWTGGTVIDGAVMYASDAHKASFWTTGTNWNGGSGWDNSTVWTIADNYLPVLKNLGGQSGGSGMYLTTKTIEYTTVTVNGTYTYNGAQQTAVFTVVLNGTTLTAGTDYILSNHQQTNAGTYSATITGVGNYTGTATGNFTIGKKTPVVGDLTYTIPSNTYTGNPQSIGSVTGTGLGAITVYYTGTSGTVYAKSDTAPTDAGTYAVTADVADSGVNYGVATGLSLGDYTIGKRALTISGFSITKAYDGNNAVSGFGTLSFTGLQNSETADVNTSAVTATYASVDVGASHNITFSGSFGMTVVTANASNYTITQPTGITGEITQASVSGVPQTLSVRSNTAKSYTFDLTKLLPSGVAAAQVSAYSFVSGDSNAIFSQNAQISDSMLTVYMDSTTAQQSAATITIGFTSGNYIISNAVITIDVVDKDIVDITGLSIAGSTYTGSAHAGYMTGTVEFKLQSGGNTVSPTNTTLTALYTSTDSGTYSDTTPPTNAGSYKVTVTLDGDTNYSGEWEGNFTISPKLLTGITFTANNKPYDGNADATVNQPTIGTGNGVVNGDNVGVNITAAAFDNENVANGKTVSIAAWELTGAAKDNYSLPTTKPTATANITAKTLTIQSAAHTKPYDGGMTATGATVALAGFEGSDSQADVSPITVMAAYTSANAGTTTLGVTAVSLGGAKGGNYTVSVPANNLTVTGITKADITGATVTQSGTLTYNGAQQTAVFTVVLNSTTLTAGTDYTLSNHQQTNAGTYSATITGAVNYTGTATGTFTIAAKPVTITGVTAASKPYNGTDVATITGTAALSDNYDDTNLTINDTGASASFSDKNAGTGKTVTFSGYALGGSAAGNYTLSSQPGNVTANITAKAVTITPDADQSKKYGEADPTFTYDDPGLGGTYGLYGSDNFTGALSHAAGVNVGTYAFNLGTLSAGSNYALTLGGSVTFEIKKADAPTGVNQTFEAVKNHEQSYGFNLTKLLPNVSPLSLGTVTYSPAITTNTDGVLGTLNYTSGNTLTLPVQSVTDAGKTATITVTISSDNYENFYAVITVKTIDKIPVTISATMNGGTYNGNPFAYTGATVKKNTDDQPVTGLTLDALYESTDGGGHNSATAPSNAGAYKLTLSVPSSNVTYSGSAVFTFSITEKTVTVKADDKAVKQGGALPAATVSYSGFIGSDNSANALTTQAAAKLNVTDSNTVGTSAIDFAANAVLNGTNGKNYTLVHVNGTLTVNPLSTACDITVVSSPSGAAISGTNITASVANGVSSQLIGLTTSADATWKLYSDSACTTEITSKTMTLNVGANTAYIKVTAEDGTTTKTYTITITRASSGGGGSNSGGGGSGSGGGSTSTTTTTPAPSGTTWLEPNPAATLANNAQDGTAGTKSTGQYGVRANAWAKLAGQKYQHDTMDGNNVQVRLYIDEPGKLTKDMVVSGYVKGAEVDKVRGIFEKWFSNKVRVIHFDQQADWEQPVGVAARVDLAGMDDKKLYFYSYDKKTNSYRRIEKPAYWIDKNGYLHFDTPYAGDIIISENSLEKK